VVRPAGILSLPPFAPGASPTKDRPTVPKRPRPLPRILRDGRLLTVTVVLATFAMHLLYVVPSTRRAAEWLMHEDYPVEDVTFLALLVASILGFRVSLQHRRAGGARLEWAFWTLLSVGLFLVAMEEVSWGQWIFFWHTPKAIQHVNGQQETNLHNLGGLQGKSDWMRLVPVVGGLVGLFLDRIPRFRRIATPRVLAGTFVMLFVYVLIDAGNDLVHVPWFFMTFNPMSEWVEMLIGLAGLAYFVIKRSEVWDEDAAGLVARDHDAARV
jgi:hypothetical protein